MQTDSVPAQCACNTVDFLARETLHIILKLCPSNSLDLNPTDYKIWGNMQEKMCHTLRQYKTWTT